VLDGDLDRLHDELSSIDQAQRLADVDGASVPARSGA
jgi:hypothetical protein